MLKAGSGTGKGWQSLFSPANITSTAGTLLSIAIVWVVSLIVVRIVNISLSRAFKGRAQRYVSDRRAQTLVPLLRSLVRYVVFFVAGVTTLSKLGVPVGSLLAAAGIGGLAVGFGAQSLVRDVITGFFLLFEDQFAVGDHVTVAGVAGIVEEMTLRVTRVRDFGGELHIIPNGQIQQVTNHMGARMRVLLDITVPHGTGPSLVNGVLDELMPRFAAGHPSVKEGPVLLGLTRVGQDGLTFQVTARAEPGQQWVIERELLAAVWDALGQHGITPAIPSTLILKGHAWPEERDSDAANANETQRR